MAVLGSGLTVAEWWRLQVCVTQERLRELLGNTRNIRHVAVVGDSRERATLVDALVSGLGGAVQVAADSSGSEVFPLDSSLSITPVLFDERTGDAGEEDPWLINLIEAHGLLECSADLDAALALSDTVLVVVDCVDGVSLSVETALKKAVVARKHVTFFISGLEKVHSTSVWAAVVESVLSATNRILKQVCFVDGWYEPVKAGVVAGNVVIGSLIGKWGVSLLEPFSVGGDAHPDCSANLITTEESSQLQRAIHLVQALGSESEHHKFNHAHLESLSPLSIAIARTIARHTPSPLLSQPLLLDQTCAEQEWAIDVAKCNQRGELVIQIVKLLSLTELNHAAAIGRVLSGKVISGQDIQVITHTRADPETNQLRFPSDSQHVQVHSARISNVGMLVGCQFHAVSTVVSAGNLCVLFGVDESIDKTAIVTTVKPDAIKTSIFFRRFTTIFRPRPVVRTTLEPENDAARVALIPEILRVGRVDLGAECYVADSGELVVAGVSEDHLQACTKRLRQRVGECFTVGDSYPCYRETVTEKTPSVCMAKSPNKHVWLYCTAEPLADALVQELTSPELAFLQPKDRKTRLTQVHGWSEQDADRIMSINCENLLVDKAPQLVHSHLLADPMLRGFRVATALGVLCEEPLHGVRVDVRKIEMVGMERHWGRAQALVALRRATLACELTSAPTLLEPVDLVEISCAPGESLVALERVIAERRGRLASQNQAGTKLRVHVPVAESSGLLEALQRASAAPSALSLQRVMDHFARVRDGALAALVRQLRARKHLDPELPPLSRFRDD